LDSEAKTEGIQDGREAVQRRVTRLRQCAIEALPIQLAALRQGSQATMGVGDVAQGKKKDTGIFVLQTGIQIVRRIGWLPESFKKTFPIRFGLDDLWHLKYSFQYFRAVTMSRAWVPVDPPHNSTTTTEPCLPK
jgi:hypothetical protein